MTLVGGSEGVTLVGGCEGVTLVGGREATAAALARACLDCLDLASHSHLPTIIQCLATLVPNVRCVCVTPSQCSLGGHVYVRTMCM